MHDFLQCKQWPHVWGFFWGTLDLSIVEDSRGWLTTLTVFLTIKQKKKRSITSFTANLLKKKETYEQKDPVTATIYWYFMWNSHSLNILRKTILACLLEESSASELHVYECLQAVSNWSGDNWGGFEHNSEISENLKYLQRWRINSEGPLRQSHSWAVIFKTAGLISQHIAQISL